MQIKKLKKNKKKLFIPAVCYAEESCFDAAGRKRRKESGARTRCGWETPSTEALQSVTAGAAGSDQTNVFHLPWSALYYLGSEGRGSQSQLTLNERQLFQYSPLFYTQSLFFFLLHFQELCKELHSKMDVTDEARYDIEVKVSRNEKEVKWHVHWPVWMLLSTCSNCNIRGPDWVSQSEDRWAEGCEAAQLEEGEENDWWHAERIQRHFETQEGWLQGQA